jgi:hypothetical protein
MQGMADMLGTIVIDCWKSDDALKAASPDLTRYFI